MDFDLTEDQRAVQDAARRFGSEKLAPYAAEWDEKEHFPVDVLRAAAELGFASIYVKGDVGGSEMTRLDAAIIFEELSAGCTSTAAFLSIHNMASWMIDRFGGEGPAQALPARSRDDEKYRELLPDRAGLRFRCGEPRTRGVKDGDHYVLTAPRRSFPAPASRTFMCAGAHRRRRTERHFLSRGRERHSRSYLRQKERKMGWNSQPTAQVIFEDRRVPIANRIGAEGEGFRIAMMGLDGGRINIGACSVGTARAALDEAKAYAHDRKQFGKPISEFQASQFKLADMATELEASRLMIRNAASALDRRDPQATMLCAMAKRFASDMGFKIANDALQLHGGYGYLKDFPAERHVRDLRVHQILEGTNEIMRVIIARESRGNDRTKPKSCSSAAALLVSSRSNRPEALNALTHGMCLAMKAQLDAWTVDAAVKTVLVRGAGERAFCAGGDIRALYDLPAAPARRTRSIFIATNISWTPRSNIFRSPMSH